MYPVTPVTPVLPVLPTTPNDERKCEYVVVPSKYKYTENAAPVVFLLFANNLITKDEYADISKLLLTSNVNKYCPIEAAVPPETSTIGTVLEFAISVSTPPLVLPYKE